MTFPGSIDGTLDFLGAHLSPDTTLRLQKLAALNGAADPWDRIAALPPRSWPNWPGPRRSRWQR